MSKSRGTFIKARTYLDYLQPEYLRYYFTAKLSDRIEDIDINFDDFTQRVNADLVGKFINIASRCASFINKHFDGQLADTCVELGLFEEFARAGDKIAAHYEKLEYSHAIRDIMALADKANQYIDEKKPWVMIKDPASKQSVQDTCSVGLNLFRILMIYLKPVLPHTAKQVETFLNIKALMWEDRETPLVKHNINEFIPLMTRIDPKQIEALKMASQSEMQSTTATPVTTEAAAPEKQYITVDDFGKIDLRIAKVLEADHVEGADKLLRLKVDLGDETRQIFAGIKSAYQPEQLVGKHVVVVANLAPRKMRFGISEGMVLAAGPGGSELWVITPDGDAKPGTRVK
jgi:methionyl-tRNA synthetase